MANLVDIVELVHPTVSGVSVPTNDTVWVLFDREVDESTVEANFFITGPDQDTWNGPEPGRYVNYESIGTEAEALQSPGYHGIVQGAITFERIRVDNYGAYTGYDYTGNGSSYRTKAVFTPSKRLYPTTEYTVYLSGDEDTTDTLDTGIKSRSVFDTVKGANLGTGEATFDGGYTGNSTDIFYVSVTTAGDVGVAKFEWWRDSDPSLVYGPYTTKRSGVLLSAGVTVCFEDGSYVVGDSFNVVVREALLFEGNVSWSFETGSGSLQTLPSSTSTTLLGTVPSTGISSGTFSVVETDPENRESNIPLPVADMDIVVVFGSAVDSDTVTSSTVSVVTEPVNGDVTNSGIIYSGMLTPTLSVSGTELTITVASGLLFTNNVVTVTLDKSISSTAGSDLGTDYTFYFTTAYEPLYSSVRKLRLDIGSYILNVPDDTINLSIFEASLEADKLTWHLPTEDNEYYKFVRRQWTTCRAAETLLMNVMQAGGGLKMKQLADLRVEYDTKGLRDALDRALGCLAKWTPTLNGGGFGISLPSMVVKGDLDADRPMVGRLWNDNRINQNVTPVANAKSTKTGSRRWRSGFYGRWGK